jgi:undecaprenyl-diphosphatase
MKSSKPFIKSYFKKLPVGLLILLVLFAGAVFLFGFVAHEVLGEKEETVDLWVFNFMSEYVVNNSLTRFMKAVTYFASARFLQIAYAALFILYLIFRDIKRAFEIAAIGIGGFLVNYFMKLSFHRLRPLNPLIEPLKNFSFPSGHATSGFIFYGLLAYLIWKTNISKTNKYVAATMLILFSVVIGFSRVYLRLHYSSDVLAGFCIGFSWLLLAIYLLERLKKKTSIEQC